MSYKNDVFKISFTGIMFSFTLLFQYLEKFMPLNMGFINLNISLIFILITNYVVDIRYVVILFILRFLFGPGLDKSGYSDIGFLSHFILLVYECLFFLVFIFIYKWSNILFLSIAFSILGISIMSGILNGLLFTPLYWAIMEKGYGLPINIEKSIKSYEYVKDFMFFGIPNYWGGMFAVYTLANVIKFSIIGFVLYSTWKILLKTPYKKYIINSTNSIKDFKKQNQLTR